MSCMALDRIAVAACMSASEAMSRQMRGPASLSSLSGPTNSSNPSNPRRVSVVADSFGAYALATGDQLTELASAAVITILA